MMTTEVNAENNIKNGRTIASPKNLRTSEVIILGEDAVEHAIESRTNESFEARLEKGLHNQKQELDRWLAWHVKNELVVQIIKERSATKPINITLAHDLVARELLLEKNRHLQGHLTIENDIIPAAMSRTEMPVAFRKGTDYWLKDIDNLHVRSGVHETMASYIGAIEATGEDGLYDLTEKYIQRVLPTAREEALTTLLQEQARLKDQAYYHESLITELKHVIGGLESEIEKRDIQLYDQSLELHMAKHATNASHSDALAKLKSAS